jgi:hypothetical protein
MMTMIDWHALLGVFLVSLGSAILVVVLVSVALVEISAWREPEVTHIHHAIFRTRLGGVIAAACLLATVALVLFGLFQIVGAGR